MNDEETKGGAATGGALANRNAQGRYAQLDESEEFNAGGGLLPESELQSARQVGKLAES